MAEGFDTGFELLPEDEPEISRDEELELLLADAGAGTPEDVEPTPTPIGRGWAFDFETNQMIRHGYAPANVRNLEHLRVWIEKTLRTARFAHEIYSDDYGAQWPDPLIGVPFTATMTGYVESAVEDALVEHDRISQVKDFVFVGGPESDLLEISFTVVLDDEELSIENLPIARTVSG